MEQIGKIEVTGRRQGNQSDAPNTPPGSFTLQDRKNMQNAGNAFQF